MKSKESDESKKMKYWVRAIKRFIKVIVWLFILFLIIMFITWTAPKIWYWALS